MSGLAPDEFKKTEKVIIIDAEGTRLLELDDEQRMLTNGSRTEKWSSCQTAELGCGRLWNPAMNPNGPTLLGGICSFCRKPPFRLFRRRKPTHGVISLEGGRNCDLCGRFTCPRHRKLGDDGLWRCPKCSRREGWKGLIRSVLFEPE